jgi:hypothetical protein
MGVIFICNYSYITIVKVGFMEVPTSVGSFYVKIKPRRK